MRTMKEELQDLAFAELYPEARESVVKRLNFLREQGQGEVQKVEKLIQEKLTESGLPHARVTGREKRPYSIWKKWNARM